MALQRGQLSIVTLIVGSIASISTAVAGYFYADSVPLLAGLLIGLTGVTLTLVLELRLKHSEIERRLSAADSDIAIAAEVARLAKIDDIFETKYADLKKEMTDLARGIYQVRTLTSLYQDDIRSIEHMRSGDQLLSTCPVTSVSKVEAARQISSPAYHGSISAHLAALKRGVKVTRIYLVRDMAYFLHPQIKQHLVELEAAGMDVRVILRDRVILDGQFDFLVFGTKKVSVGVAEPGAGTVSGATVYTDDTIVRRYISEYGKLRVLSKAPSELLGERDTKGSQP